MWGLLANFDFRFFWLSSSLDYDNEIAEVRTAVGVAVVYDVNEPLFRMNTKRDPNYSLMWSLAFIRKMREENWGQLVKNWMINENNWKSQVEKDFADAEKN